MILDDNLNSPCADFLKFRFSKSYLKRAFPRFFKHLDAFISYLDHCSSEFFLKIR
uniref:(California timema) hypothetical protein n=1 Tax=Timema californicum TaxID=61474 RepID=A0A7R9JBB8_TIMCA|nr:unnamed protein product [Timema californicum]